MKDPEIPEYLGKAAVPGIGKQMSQDRTRTLTSYSELIQKAGRGELFALFDGMGSKGQAGADAAEVMCDMVTDFFRKTEEFPATSEGLQRLLLRGNQKISEWGLDPDTGRCIGGCVGSVLWIYDEQIHVFHAGDTAVYSVTDNVSKRLTKRHCDEQGLITSFFGAGQGLQMEIKNFSLLQVDYLVLVSDGVADRCLPEDIAEIVYSQEPQQSVQELVRLAKNRKAQDDLTAIVIDAADMLF